MTDAPEPPPYDPDLRVYLRPLAIEPDGAEDGGRPLAGTGLRFHALEAVLRRGPADIERVRLTMDEAEAWAARRGVLARLAASLARASAPRPAVAGLEFDRPRLMGIVNVTPDSFSDGGDFFDSGRAVAHGLALREAGADILDVGGESTRPGAEPVPEEEERRRVLPVIRALADAGAVVSVDTRRAGTMAAALEAGAVIVNDVSALRHDPESLATVARTGAPVVLMHMLGEPGTMQQAPAYDDAALDIHDFLAARIAACEAAGIARERLIVDPGIGFGKTAAHNLELLRRLAVFHGLGCALMVGASRKRFIGAIAHGGAGDSPKERVAGSLAAALSAAARGAQLLRVHDVAETARALAVWQAIAAA